MKKNLYRFVALGLVPAIILADPSWAAIQRFPGDSSALRCETTPILTQAITPRSLLPGPGRTQMWLARGYQRFLPIVGAGLVLASLIQPVKLVSQDTKFPNVHPPSAPTAQTEAPAPQKKTQMEKAFEKFPYLEQSAKAPSTDNRWRVTLPPPKYLETRSDLMPYVINNNGKLNEDFPGILSTMDLWCAKLSPLLVATYGSDANNFLRLSTNGFHWSDQQINPRVQVLTPRLPGNPLLPPHDTLWKLFWRSARDLVLNGGIVVHVPKSVVERALLEGQIEGTQVDIQYVDLNGDGWVAILTGQRTLNALLQRDSDIRAKRIEVLYYQKALASAQAPADVRFDPPDVSADVVQIQQKLRKATRELNELENGTKDHPETGLGGLENSMRLQMTRTAEDFNQMPILHRRPAKVALSLETVVAMANLELPNVKGPPAMTLERAKEIEQSLVRGMNKRLAKQGVVLHSVFDPQFLPDILDSLWSVKGFSGSVLPNPVDESPNRSVNIALLMRPLSETYTLDEDPVLANEIPALASYEWQKEQTKNSRDLLEIEKHPGLAVLINVNWSKLFPVGLRFEGHRVIDPTQINLEQMSDAERAKYFEQLKVTYKQEHLLAPILALQQIQEGDLKDIKAEAGDLLANLDALDQEMNPGGTKGNARAEFQPLAEAVAVDLEHLRGLLIGLQGVEDEKDLYTPTAFQEIKQEIDTHFEQSTTPEPQAALHSMGLMGLWELPHGMNWINGNIPHYWSNPLLGWVTAAMLAVFIGVIPYFRNNTRKNKYNYWNWQIPLTGVLFFAIPGSVALRGVLAGLVLGAARGIYILRYTRYDKGTIPFKIIRFLHLALKSTSAIALASIAWLILTVGHIATPPALWIYHRLADSIHFDTNRPEKISSTVASKNLYLGAPPHRHGILAEPPAQSKVKGMLSAWKDSSDATTLELAERLNERLSSFGIQIQNLAELDTQRPDSRYARANFKFVSNGLVESGSIADRLSKVFRPMEEIIDLAEQARDDAAKNRRTTRSNAQSALEEAYRHELRQLAKAASTILEERAYDDLPSKRPFELLPDVNQLSATNALDRSESLLIGTEDLLEYGSFTFHFTDHEVRKFQAFFTNPDNLIVMVDKETQKPFYFRARDVRQTTFAPDGKGFLPKFLTEENAALGRYRIVVEVRLPFGQKMPTAPSNYSMDDFYLPHVLVSPGTLKEDRDKDHLEAPAVPSGSYIALGMLMPNHTIFVRQDGPDRALAEEISDYKQARADFVGLKSEAAATIARGEATGSTADAKRANYAKGIANKCQTEIDRLDQRAAETVAAQIEWENYGPVVKNGKLPNGNGVYPADRIGEETNPIPVRTPTRLNRNDPNASDPQSYYVLTKDNRLRIFVRTIDMAALEIHEGELFYVFTPGSKVKVPVRYIRDKNYAERDLDAGAITSEAPLSSQDIQALFPETQWNSDGGPNGVTVLYFGKEETSTTPVPTSQVAPAPNTPTPGLMGFVSSTIKNRTVLTVLLMFGASMFGHSQTANLSAFAPHVTVAPVHTTFWDDIWLRGIQVMMYAGAAFVALYVVRWVWKKFFQAPEVIVPPKPREPGIYADRDQPIFYGGDALIRRESRFLHAIGGQEISHGTVIAAGALKRLKTRWKKFEDKKDVADAIRREIQVIVDPEILNFLATFFSINTDDPLADSRTLADIQKGIYELHAKHGIPAKKIAEDERTRKQELLDWMRYEVAAEVNRKFQKIRLVAMDTERGDALVDIVQWNGERLMYIDTELLEGIVKELHDSDPTVRAKAQKALAILFIYVAAAPTASPNGESRNAEGLSLFTVKQQEFRDFQSMMDTLVEHLEGSDPFFIPWMDSFRAERDKRHSPLTIGITGREDALGPVGLSMLRDELTNQPTLAERKDASGKSLSPEAIIFNRYQSDDVTMKLAKQIREDYHITNVVDPRSNKRSTFILRTYKFWFGFFLAWVIWPPLLMALLRPLFFSNLSYNLYTTGVEPGVPHFFFKLFVGVLVIAFFQGVAFKPPAEFISASELLLKRFKFFARNGSSARLKQEFHTLTGVTAAKVVEDAIHTPPMTDDQGGRFRKRFETSTLMVMTRAYRWLSDREDKRDFSIKRNVVSALYRWQGQMPDTSFFKGFRRLQLKNDEQIFRHVFNNEDKRSTSRKKDVMLHQAEIERLFTPRFKKFVRRLEEDLHWPGGLSPEDFRRFRTADQQWQVLVSLRRQGYYLEPDDKTSPLDVECRILDDHRRETMEDRRVQLAIPEILNAPADAWCAFMSANLLGIGFADAWRALSYERETEELLREATRDAVERMRTLNPALYRIYGQHRRMAKQASFIHAIIADLKDAKHADDIGDVFTNALSDVDIDATRPDMDPFLTDPEREQIATWKPRFERFERYVPSIVRAFKWHKGILDRRPYPVDRLARYLLLKHSNAADLAAYRQEAVKNLDELLKILLHNVPADRHRVHEAAQSEDIAMLRRPAEMSSRPDRPIDIEDILFRYLSASADDEKRKSVCLEYLDAVNIPDSQKDGFAMQQGRRYEFRVDQATFDEKARLIAGENLEDPTRFPDYMEDRFLQNEALTTTTDNAGLFRVTDESEALEDKIIGATPRGAPKLLGIREMAMDIGLAHTIQKVVRNMAREAGETDGDIHYAGIGDILKPFVDEVFARMPHRLPSNITDRLYPLLWDQIIGHLREPGSGIPPMVFLSPEYQSVQTIVDDPRLTKVDLIGVPHPKFKSAANILYWWYMTSPSEKETFLTNLKPNFTRNQLMEQVDAVHYLVRSNGVNIHVGPWSDKLRTAKSFTTLYFIPAHGAPRIRSRADLTQQAA